MRRARAAVRVGRPPGNAKAPDPATGGPWRVAMPATSDHHLRLVETVVNVVESLGPTAVTAPMMTTAIRAAIKPYSIAVAPESSRTKRANNCIKIYSFRLSSAAAVGQLRR